MTDYVFYEIQFHFRQKNINIMLNGKLGIRKQHEFPNTYD